VNTYTNTNIVLLYLPFPQFSRYVIRDKLCRGAGAGPAAPLPKQCANPEIHCRPAIVWHSIA
jgi:hypothetical protein